MKFLLIYDSKGKELLGKVNEKLNIKTNNNDLKNLLIKKMKDILPLRTGKKEGDKCVTEIIKVNKKSDLYLYAVAEELLNDNLVAFVEV